MVYVPPGTFTMGSSDSNPWQLKHQVTLTKPFCIDQTPVTVDAYKKCVDEKVCSEPYKQLSTNYGWEGREQHPVNSVTWNQADSYCSWVHKRLPSEAEWVLAAFGTDGRKYPWGNEPPDDTRLHCSQTERLMSTAPVGSHPAGASPYGALDMLGNVDQYVSGWMGKYDGGTEIDPLGPSSGEVRIVRGAGYDVRAAFLRPEDRHPATPNSHLSQGGFRCARSLEAN